MIRKKVRARPPCRIRNVELRRHEQERHRADNDAERTVPPATTMTRRRLPIGIQTFRGIREEGCWSPLVLRGHVLAIEGELIAVPG